MKERRNQQTTRITIDSRISYAQTIGVKPLWKPSDVGCRGFEIRMPGLLVATPDVGPSPECLFRNCQDKMCICIDTDHRRLRIQRLGRRHSLNALVKIIKYEWINHCCIPRQALLQSIPYKAYPSKRAAKCHLFGWKPHNMDPDLQIFRNCDFRHLGADISSDWICTTAPVLWAWNYSQTSRNLSTLLALLVSQLLPNINATSVTP